jgi:hypothetical protein
MKVAMSAVVLIVVVNDWAVGVRCQFTLSATVRPQTMQATKTVDN